MAKEIHVGNVFMMVDDDGKKFRGMEMLFTSNVENVNGATVVLDALKSSMNSSAWMLNTVLRVGGGDAQTDSGAVEGSQSRGVSDTEETKVDDQ